MPLQISAAELHASLQSSDKPRLTLVGTDRVEPAAPIGASIRKFLNSEGLVDLVASPPGDNQGVLGSIDTLVTKKLNHFPPKRADRVAYRALATVQAEAIGDGLAGKGTWAPVIPSFSKQH